MARKRETGPRRPRWLPPALLAIGILVATASASAIVNRLDGGRIAPHSLIAGVPVGGLSGAGAQQRLQEVLLPRLQQPIAARSGNESFLLSAARTQVRADLRAMVAEALSASHRHFFIARAFEELTGTAPATNVPLRVHYSSAALSGFIADVAHALDTPARDASVAYSASAISVLPARSGRRVLRAQFDRQLIAALEDPGGSRTFSVPVRTIAPTVRNRDLRRRYPAIIVINREGFQLRLYRDLTLAHTYPIAVGMQGLQTPAGLYDVQEKEVDPPWQVPNSSWAGPLAGRLIPPGPNDPIKARWIGFAGAAGIHGIDPSEYNTIGHDASHGCVRMRIPDVISLYDQVRTGAPVYIG